MSKLVALVRAVNVGGTGKLPMDVLRDICERASFVNVRTYIQSGNVIFDADVSADVVKAELEARLENHVGKPVGVIVRNADQMRSVLERNPFSSSSPNRIAILFLDLAPAPDAVKTAKGQSDEEIVLGEREIFINYPSGMGRSRLKLADMDHGTTRNLNAVPRLAAMASCEA